MKKTLNIIFITCVCAALALAVAYVLLQIAAIITVSGSLSVWAENNLETPVCVMCSLSSIAAFVMSYVYKWQSGD